MSLLLRLILSAIRHLFTSRGQLVLENLALRQQLALYEHERPNPTLADPDRAFWVAMKNHLRTWADVLVIVKPSSEGQLTPKAPRLGKTRARVSRCARRVQ